VGLLLGPQEQGVSPLRHEPTHRAGPWGVGGVWGNGWRLYCARQEGRSTHECGLHAKHDSVARRAAAPLRADRTLAPRCIRRASIRLVLPVGTSRNDTAQVLPPFSQPVKGLTGQFLDLQRRRAIDTPAGHSSLTVDTTVMDIVPREGETLGWGEGPVRGRRTVPGKLANLDSGATADVMASNWTVGELPTVIGMSRAAARSSRRGVSSMPPSSSSLPAAATAEEAVAASMQARTSTWRDAFARFPRQADGSVRTHDFVATLSKLAAATAGDAPNGAGTVGAGAAAKTLSAEELSRVASLVDPDRTGVVTFPTFAKVSRDLKPSRLAATLHSEMAYLCHRYPVRRCSRRSCPRDQPPRRCTLMARRRGARTRGRRASTRQAPRRAGPPRWRRR